MVEIKNILYFAPCDIDGGVGGSARLQSMTDIMKKNNFRIDLISYQSKKNVLIKILRSKEDQLSIFKIQINDRFPKLIKGLFAITILFIGMLKTRKCNLIFSHSPSIITGMPGYICSKIYNKPLIIDHMDSRDHDTPRYFYELVLKKATCVLAISDRLFEETKTIGNHHVRHFPIFINPNIFKRNEDASQSLKERLGILDKVIIGYAGSFSKTEGVPVLINAFNLLPLNDAVLILIGSKNVAGSDDIEKLIPKDKGNKIILLNPVPRSEIANIMSTFDIACVPKINCIQNQMASPVKIFEYMSCECIVVSSAVGEIINIIENGINGFLTKPGDTHELGELLSKIVNNINNYRDVGRQARCDIKKKFSEDGAAILLKEIIDDYAR